MDVSLVLFPPFFAVAATTVIAAPIAAVGYVRWRLRATRRITNGCCGHCNAAFALGDEQFVVTGVRICGVCAAVLRVRLGRVLMGVAIGVLGFGALAVGTIALDFIVDGPAVLSWLSKGGRWWAVAVPSVGVAAGVGVLVSAAKAANRLSAGTTSRTLGTSREPLLPREGV